jgi:predicted ATPase
VIKRLRLENFKGVVEGEVELDKLTILVGPNNSGKSPNCYSIAARIS